MQDKKTSRKFETQDSTAKEHEVAGDLAAAEKFYRKELEIHRNPGTWGLLGWTLLQRSMSESADSFKEALAAAKKMRDMVLKQRSKPLLAVADCLIGKIHQDAGRKVLAERYYRESVDAAPRTETYVFLGALMNELDRSTESKVCYQRAIEIEPRNREAHFNLALWYKSHQDFDRAVWYLQKTLEVDENYSPAVMHLATLLWRTGIDGLDEARQLLENALNSNPEDVRLNILLAVTHWLHKNSSEAEQQFLRTIKELPRDSRVLWAFAVFLADDRKNPAEAENYFKQAIKTEPRDGAANFYYARFLLEHERNEEAKDQLSKAAQLHFKKADTFLATLKEAEIYEQ